MYEFLIKKRFFLFTIVILVTSICFNLFSVKNILYNVYKWHLVQPESIQGGIEIICFYIALLICLLNITKKSYIKFIFLILVAIYLQLHQVLLPAILGLLYFEIIISVGFSVKYFFKNSTENLDFRDYLTSFLVGFITWSIITLSSSLLGYGSFTDLRIITLVLGLLSFTKSFKTLSWFVFKKLDQLNTKSKSYLTFLLCLVMTQFAKTNRALDYDSLWYGLRPEQVLVGPNSFFDNIGMIMSVHYYPKLMEFFSLPLSNLGDYSFIMSVNILFYLMLLIVVYLFSKELSGNRDLSLFSVVLIGCIPAISNMASTAKTDIFSSFFIVCSAYFLWVGCSKHYLSYINYGLAAGVLSLGGKITSLMYLPLLLLGFVCILIYRRISEGKHKFLQQNIKLNLYILLSAFYVVFVICYRTYKLTGFPFYPILGGLWNKIGFEAKTPFFERPNDFILSEDKSFFTHWLKVVFDPGEYTHYVMVWPSNLYILIWIIVVLLLAFYRKKISFQLYVPFLTFLPLFLSAIYNINSLPQGGDGNYYIPVIILTIISFIPIIQHLSKDKKKVIILALSLFIPIQTSVMFVSHFSWSWGTSVFNGQINKTNFEAESRKLSLFDDNGLREIEEYLSKNSESESKNCIGFLRNDGDEQIMNQLSCRFEDVPHMNSRYGNSEIFNSVEKFKQYLLWADVKYIILPKIGYDNFEIIKSVINELESSKNTKRIDSREFYLLEILDSDIPAVEGISNLFDSADLLDGWFPEENSYRWITDNAKGVFESPNNSILINGSVPEELEKIILTVRINQRIQHFEMDKGDFEIEVTVPAQKKFEMELLVDKSFVPKEMGINDDTRELSLVIKNIVSK